MHIAGAISQSGGVGKTTLICTLAICAFLDGLTVGVVDADEEGSGAFGWSGERRKRVAKELVEGGKFPTFKEAHEYLKQAQLPLPRFSLVATPERLQEAVDAARADGFDWLFIDTAAGRSALARKAAELADVVLIPSKMSGNKIRQAAPTASLMKELGKQRAFFVVNEGSTSKAINDECALKLTSKHGLPATAMHITHRKSIMWAEFKGMALPEIENPDATTRNGAEEFRALWGWLRDQMETEGENQDEHEEKHRGVALR